MVPRPDESGTREILDLVILRNDGDRTRVAPDSLAHHLGRRLPPGSGGMEVGESDVSPDAVVREGDSV